MDDQSHSLYDTDRYDFQTWIFVAFAVGLSCAALTALLGPAVLK